MTALQAHSKEKYNECEGTPAFSHDCQVAVSHRHYMLPEPLVQTIAGPEGKSRSVSAPDRP